jgi:hypothetical protein
MLIQSKGVLSKMLTQNKGDLDSIGLKNILQGNKTGNN